MKDDAEERAIDLEAAVVFDEAKFPELVHEEVDTGPRRADHLGERFLRQLWQVALRRVRFAIAREQQQRTSEPLFARVEELIDEVLFDPDVSDEHVGDETVRELRLLVQRANHLLFRDPHHRRRHHGCRRTHPQRLSCQATLAEKVAGSEHGDNRLFACRRHDRELHAAILDIEDAGRLGALSKDGRTAGEAHDPARHTRRVEKRLNIKLLSWLSARRFHGHSRPHHRMVQRTESHRIEIT